LFHPKTARRKNWMDLYHGINMGLDIEAAQLTTENAEELAKTCNGLIVEEINPFDDSERRLGINVPTEQGNKRLSVGSYLVHYADFFFVWKEDEFLRHWEKK